MAGRAPKSGVKPRPLTNSRPKSRARSKAEKNTADGGQIKTKRATTAASSSKSKSKAKRTYTDKELNLPTLNMITPAGVDRPRGKKKGKVFVDDAVSMRTILAIVSADKNGQIESKMQKARQMEEIREARRQEMEEKERSRKRKLQEVREGLRRKAAKAAQPDLDTSIGVDIPNLSSGKRVSFG